MTSQETARDAWLATRPECVQRLAAEFPAGDTVVDVKGVPHFVIGWNESDMLIVSPIDPCDDYDAAVTAKQYVCAKHYRKE